MDAEHDALAFMVDCPAWEGLYKASVAERVKGLYKSLERDGITLQQVHDALGQIKALRWAITWPELEIDQAREEDRRVDEEKVAENLTNVIVMYGHSLGADHQGGRE